MKTLITPIIVKYAGLLFSAYLIAYFLSYHDVIPDSIIDGKIKTNGLILGASAIAVSIYSIKEMIKNYPAFSIVRLVAISMIIGFTSNMAFQVIRYFTSDFDLYTCVLSGIRMTLFYGVIAFLTAFKVKTQKNNIFWLMIIAIAVVSNLALKYFNYN